MTSEVCSITGSVSAVCEAAEGRDLILQNWAIPALVERGFRKFAANSYVKNYHHRGDSARVIVNFDPNKDIHVELELTHTAALGEQKPVYQVIWSNYVDELYVPQVVDALRLAFKAIKRSQFRYPLDCQHAISMFVGPALRDSLPPGVDISQIWRRPSLGEAVDPKEFILANPRNHYRVYRLNWNNWNDYVEVYAASAQEAYDEVKTAYDRPVSVKDDEGNIFKPDFTDKLQPLEGLQPPSAAESLEDDTDNARRELLDVDEPWDGPWRDLLLGAGFERVRADQWYKQYPFSEGYIFILAEPHLNMPDLEGTDQTNPVIRLYCEYSNPHGDVDYPIQVFQRWVPLKTFPKAMEFIDSAMKLTEQGTLEQLQAALEPGFYRLVPPLGPLVSEGQEVDAREFIGNDPMIAFRSAMEAEGWKFKRLVKVPRVDGGEVLQHEFKFVSQGTIWTISASVLGDGRIDTYGNGFKVLQGYDHEGREQMHDDEWELDEIVQEVGMSPEDLAELVTDRALRKTGENEQEHDFNADV